MHNSNKTVITFPVSVEMQRDLRIVGLLALHGMTVSHSVKCDAKEGHMCDPPVIVRQMLPGHHWYSLAQRVMVHSFKGSLHKSVLRTPVVHHSFTANQDPTSSLWGPIHEMTQSTNLHILLKHHRLEASVASSRSCGGQLQ